MNNECFGVPCNRSGPHNSWCHRYTLNESPLAPWERNLLNRVNLDRHEEGFGEVTFHRTDGEKVVVDNVDIDSIGPDGSRKYIIACEVKNNDVLVHVPWVTHWTIEYRY